MSGSGGSPTDAEPRWLVDEMLGRLARYLRFLGYDTAYARSRSDAEIRAWAEREGRILLTRDRQLAARTAGAVLLTSPQIERQLIALRAARPDLRATVRFDRCTLCNGPLAPRPTEPRTNLPSPAVVDRWVCIVCGHEYWEGSHTRAIRRRLEAWLSAPVP